MLCLAKYLREEYYPSLGFTLAEAVQLYGSGSKVKLMVDSYIGNLHPAKPIAAKNKVIESNQKEIAQKNKDKKTNKNISRRLIYRIAARIARLVDDNKIIKGFWRLIRKVRSKPL